jgi:hypothetical protein
MIKVIFYFLIGYIIYKGYKILLSLLSNSSGKKSEQKVYGSENSSKKINKDDIIEAHFEDLDDKEDPTENK